MFKLFQTTCAIVACSIELTTAKALNFTPGILEADLVFPRNGDKYAPTNQLPIVFGFQNMSDETLTLANNFRPRLQYSIWNQNNASNKIEKAEFDLFAYAVSLAWPNKLWHEYYDIFRVEGSWQMNWTMRWQDCDGDGGLKNVTSAQSISFSTEKSVPDYDLLAHTSNKTACSNSGGMGVAWNIAAMRGTPGEDDRCAEMASTQPTPTPCKISIQSADANSIAEDKPADNDPEPTPSPEAKSGAQSLSTRGASCLLVFWGLLIHVLL